MHESEQLQATRLKYTKAREQLSPVEKVSNELVSEGIGIMYSFMLYVSTSRGFCLPLKERKSHQSEKKNTKAHRLTGKEHAGRRHRAPVASQETA